MAYGLPTRGQRDWDDEINNSLEAVRSDAQAASAQASAAVSTANNALNVAQAAQAQSAASDATVAALVPDTATATGAAVAGAIEDKVSTDAVDTGSAIGAALSATIEAETKVGGTRVAARTVGDGLAGFIDWDHQGNTGYGVHLTAGPASSGDPEASTTGLVSVLAIGTDRRNITGMFVSHKNSGAGVHIAQQPGSSLGLFKQGYSTSTLDYSEVYGGNQGVKIVSRKGQAYSDGTTTSGSTTFTSATATFTAGDVGKAISQLTYTGKADNPAGTIPSGTTIATYVSATEVTLSQAATASATALRFLVADRIPSGAQKLLTIFDHDDAGVFQVYRTLIDTQVPILAKVRTASQTPITIQGMAAGTQTGDLVKVLRDGDSNGAFAVNANGLTVARMGQSVQNSLATSTIPLTVNNSGAGTIAAAINAAVSQSADILQINANGGVNKSRFGPTGAFYTKVTTAPSDGALFASEVALWFDSTNGAAKLMMKGKSADGTVVTGSVALA